MELIQQKLAEQQAQHAQMMASLIPQPMGAPPPGGGMSKAGGPPSAPAPPGLMGGFPGWPGMSGLPGGMGGGAPAPPGLSGMPGMPPMPGMPGMPGLSGGMSKASGPPPSMPGMMGSGAMPPPPGGGDSGAGPAAPPAFGGAPGHFPSMADLAKNTTVGGSDGTVKDNDVKVFDPYGQLVPQPLCYKTFEDTPFAPSIKADLAKAGFPAPSQIQSYCWPLAVAGNDVIGVAATGSGKTISFLLPAFSSILTQNIPAGDPSFLVLAPTRELAVQIEEEAVKFGRNSGLKTTCLYGGAPKPPQAQALRAGLHGVIGTPGRVNDFCESGQLRLGRVAKLVLDEADRMLDMGFEPQLQKILKYVPPVRHTMFFTATWPKGVQRVASEFIRGGYKVEIGNRDELKGNQDIVQMVKLCTQYDKQKVLFDILKQAGVADRSNANAKGLVFCGTKKMCDQLANQLYRSGVPSSSIHGDKGQREREQALGELKSGQIKTLVATDVAARGIDIKGVTLVVNYDLPANTEDYVHRIGRTGRAGQKGYAVALVTDRDAGPLKGVIEVMKRTNQAVPPEVETLAASFTGGGKGSRYRDGDGGKGGGKSKGDKGGKSDFGGMPPMGMSGGMPPMGMPGMPPSGMPGMPPMGGDRDSGGGGSRNLRDRSRSRRRRSPSRRRRSPSRRRRSPSRRRRSPSRRRRSPSRRRRRSPSRRRRSPSVKRQRDPSGEPPKADDAGANGGGGKSRSRSGGRDKDKKRRRRRSSSSS